MKTKDSATVALALMMAVPALAQPSSSFRDDFVGESLAPEFRVLNPDPNRMAMVDGDYLLLVTHQDAKNVIAYSPQLPEDYEVIVRFQSVPAYTYQGAGLVLSEGDNSLSSGLYVECCSQYQFYATKTLKDESSRYEAVIPNENAKPFYLKVTKRGVEYDSEYSFDGTTWSQIGTHVAVKPFSQVRIQVYNRNDDAPESGIRVDSFEIVDRSAP
jgi:hypothetical protein